MFRQNEFYLCLLLTAVLGFVSLNTDMYAQDGRWVGYSLDTLGSGVSYYDCGDGCIGHTQSNSQYVLIFDIKIGEWVLVDLGVVQIFKYLETEGNVVLAWSEDLLFGYSSSLGVWDTIHYEGTLLNDHSSQPYRSYGCSDSLAFFVTDQKFYVFDGSLGSWQQYDYGLPANFSNGLYYPKVDCIILVLQKTDLYADIINVVYSSHTQTFNKLEDGCTISQQKYDHGYAGMIDKTGMGKDFLLVGYSAFDNQFDVIPYSTGENEAAVYFYNTGTIEADTFIAYTSGFRTVVTPFILVRVKFYGYSTILGAWNTVTYDIDWEAESYYGNGNIGGQFTFDLSTEKDISHYRFFLYSARDGQFNKIHTDLVYTSTTSAFQVGGSVLCVFDAQYGWGFNPVENHGELIPLGYDHTTNFSAADDYATFCRWSPTSDTMRMYFYNSNTNKWSWIDTQKQISVGGNTTPHVYLYKTWPENKIIVYSSSHDMIMQRNFPDSIYVYSKINGVLAYARSEHQSFLFNTEKCSVHEKDFEFNQNGLGTMSAAFFNTTGKILHGYSSLTDQWTTHTISEEPYYCYDPGYIGLISAWVGMNGFGKFYTYNGLADSWVELISQGNYVSHLVGNRTALVIQSTHLYAFDPYAQTNFNEEQKNLIQAGFTLQQNYPNPFNSSTTIDYELTNPSRVVLKIYNMFGQEIRILTNEYQTAGKWSVTWDGRDSNNQPTSSGIYIYQIKAGNSLQSRRMILLKSDNL